jgi:hypothetical protein
MYSKLYYEIINITWHDHGSTGRPVERGAVNGMVLRGEYNQCLSYLCTKTV